MKKTATKIKFPAIPKGLPKEGEWLEVHFVTKKPQGEFDVRLTACVTGILQPNSVELTFFLSVDGYYLIYFPDERSWSVISAPQDINMRQHVYRARVYHLGGDEELLGPKALPKK